MARRPWGARLSAFWPASWLPDTLVLKHRAIPDALWQHTLQNYPFLTWRSASAQQRLRELSTLFLARKEFTPAGGLRLTDDMAVAIAAQACLPILPWGLRAYERFVSVVVHPDQVVARRTVTDEAGVVHHYDEVLAGESMPDGPVMLSWHDVQQAQDMTQGYNVVIHEFAHALDMLNGQADGTPPLPPHLSARQWQDTLWQAFDRHRDALAHGDTPWLDPYAAQDGLTEFFPVVTEAFFVAPTRLQAEHPDVYALLCSYFDETPAAYDVPRDELPPP
ncbi:MAG TPA: M90 family metallopeptidase [Aquabacterium sp.]|uniref:M90 family metallopeptidase n=1 Tax=Aquabacterium sp. TaxID=1872578 RepID=UPI002E325DF1|nr:M90 family metallopeptidase [Aquabacterium sp.]HEX5371747.1 M90 family metallopeptidase [Aquabacterium sp.]